MSWEGVSNGEVNGEERGVVQKQGFQGFCAHVWYTGGRGRDYLLRFMKANLSSRHTGVLVKV